MKEKGHRCWSKRGQDTKGSYRPRPHINAEPHRRLTEELEAMTDQERSKFLLEISVKAGIYAPDGGLMPFYRGEGEAEQEPSGETEGKAAG